MLDLDAQGNASKTLQSYTTSITASQLFEPNYDIQEKIGNNSSSLEVIGSDVYLADAQKR